MKKILSVILSLLLLLFPISSFAESYFSDFSVPELYELRSLISSEILSRREYKHVEVPQGYYVVGEDIPSGHWTITAASGSYCLIEYFKNADFSGHRPADAIYDYFYLGLAGENSNAPSTYENTSIDLNLQDGFHFVVNYGMAVFEPYTGRTSPFFN